MHVNTGNTDPSWYNPSDPMSGFAGIPRNMTGIATKLKQAGYRTVQVGKWDAGECSENEPTPMPPHHLIVLVVLLWSLLSPVLWGC